VSGSFAIGFLTMALARWLPHPNMRLLVVVGFLGGYTTFSTFAFESLMLWERGEIGLSLTNMIGSVAVGMIAVGLGVGLARTLTMPAAERATRSDREIRAPLESRPRQVVGPAGPKIGLQVDDSAGSGNGQGEGTAEVEKFGSSS
ncbi:MAG: CrcB family protein, partial [Planctomycetaceae bacterium]|nr:CrcB family protein [Planctomycetaceae bacterium]